MSKGGSDNRNIRVLQFLDAYQKQESLWNPALESYKNKAARDEAYLNIIRELNVPSLTIHDVKLKVKSIRTTYTKELRLLTKHKDQGKPYNPKLFWFNRANVFLRNVSLSRDKRQSLSSKLNVSEDYKPCVIDDYIADIAERQSPTVEMESADNISNAEEDAGNTSSSTYEYKTLRNNELDTHIGEDIAMTTSHVDETNVLKQQTEEYQQQLVPAKNIVIGHHHVSTSNNGHNIQMEAPSNFVNVTSSLCSTKSSSMLAAADDDYDLFCRSVAAQLRGITDTYSRSVAKLKIQQILFEAETGHYRNSPCITIPVNQHMNSV